MIGMMPGDGPRVHGMTARSAGRRFRGAGGDSRLVQSSHFPAVQGAAERTSLLQYVLLFATSRCVCSHLAQAHPRPRLVYLTI